MFRNSQYPFKSTNSRRTTRLSPYGAVSIFTIHCKRSITSSTCRFKVPDLNSKNYYDILGVERTATQKEIKKAFYKLSKQYHPDSNSADKSSHAKFVKINEAFGVLSKESSRVNYDQIVASPFRPPPPSPSDPRSYSSSAQSSSNFGSSTRRPNPFTSDWTNRSHFDRTFYELLRRRLQQERQRNPKDQWNNPNMSTTYFVPFSIISFLIGFGVLIHVLKGRMVQFDDSQFERDPRTRNYHAYREWQRLSALKDAKSMSMREGSRKSPSESDEKA